MSMHRFIGARFALPAAVALAFLAASARAGHDNVEVDPALKRYTGRVAALGAPDAAGRVYSFRAEPLGPRAPAAYAPGELRGWRVTLLTGRRFANAFEVATNSESEITVSARDGPLDGLAARDVFVVEQIALPRSADKPAR